VSDSDPKEGFEPALQVVDTIGVDESVVELYHQMYHHESEARRLCGKA
jgi:hypothetical protein